MDMDGFKGRAKPLDEFDIPKLAHRINVSEDALRAFIEVEAAGRPFDAQGRPAMLFEPHLFYRNLSGAQRDEAVKRGLAYPRWGAKAYPRDSYPRLESAMQINPDAALRSASWGASQVLGSNFAVVGYSSPEAMVRAFMDDAEEHVEAMVKFILANGIDDDIRAGRWETVARVYNGPGYARHGYHTKLAAAARKWGARPDSDWQADAPEPSRISVTADVVMQVQRRLHELGYHEAGTPDGKWGTRTRAAVLAFRADNDMPIIADIDQPLLAALMVAARRDIAPQRAEATAADLRAEGSTTIKTTDAGAAVGTASVALTGLAAASQQIDDLTSQVGSVQRLVDAVQPLIEAVSANALWLVGGLAVFLIWQARTVRQQRVQAHRTGRHVGR